jgi:translation initiation factor IF-2
MKNSTSVAGTALATPLTRYTASRRRKAGVRSGSGQAGAAPARWAMRGAARAPAAPRHGQRHGEDRLVTDSPATDGSTLATSTPSSARPSRQDTMRARWPSSPPSRAPQAWCSTTARCSSGRSRPAAPRTRPAGRRCPRRREEEAAKAQRQHQRGQQRRAQHARRRVGEPAVDPAADPAGRPRRPAAARPAAARPAWPAGCRTRWRSGWAAPRTAAAPRRPAAGPGRRRQALGPAAAPAGAAPVAVMAGRGGHGGPAQQRSCSRSAGSEVCGDSQMPKNRRAKSASRTSPRSVPLAKKQRRCRAVHRR